MIRHLFVWLHRWAGLLMVILEGLTGSLLAFNTELTRLLDPQILAIITLTQHICVVQRQCAASLILPEWPPRWSGRARFVFQREICA